MNMRILGTGSAVPKSIITNDDLGKIVDTNDEWIKERTGIAKRHVSDGDTVATLGASACMKALENAGKKAEDVELIIVATCSPEMALPCAACQVQSMIGATKAVAFDLNAACSGFLFALNTAFSFFSVGSYKNALIIGSEVLSKIVDWEDRNTCILFGDGAGAVYVEAVDEECKYSFVQHANGAKGNVLACGYRDVKNPLYEEKDNISNKFVSMDGREVFKFAVRSVPECINEVLEKEGIETSDVDYFVLHQANIRIIQGIANKLGCDMDKFPNNLAEYGNMSSATIPVLLDELNRNGILERGMRLVLSGFGAGLTYGATIISW